MAPEQFTDFLAHHYHSPSDDLSLPINWQPARASPG